MSAENPSLEAIAKAYDEGRGSLIVASLIADLETPVSAYLKLAAHRAGHLFLLESVEGGANRGRYSMIGLDPDVIWRCRAGRADINRQALSDRQAFEPCAGQPLESLRLLLAEIFNRIMAGTAAHGRRCFRLSRL